MGCYLHCHCYLFIICAAATQTKASPVMHPEVFLHQMVSLPQPSLFVGLGTSFEYAHLHTHHLYSSSCQVFSVAVGTGRGLLCTERAVQGWQVPDDSQQSVKNKQRHGGFSEDPRRQGN